ncbi:MAG TPA: hypothetical protein VFC39_14015 [Acidobacteriaceae bacterium]|nr:hypothetical protein [Acidobacteriaceae bacterium]
MIDMQQFEREGFAMTPSLLSLDQLAEFITLIEAHASPKQKRGGVRDIMTHLPQLRAVADAPPCAKSSRKYLGRKQWLSVQHSSIKQMAPTGKCLGIRM